MLRQGKTKRPYRPAAMAIGLCCYSGPARSAGDKSVVDPQGVVFGIDFQIRKCIAQPCDYFRRIEATDRFKANINFDSC